MSPTRDCSKEWNLRRSSKPQIFLAVIDTCTVIPDDGKIVVGDVKFKDGETQSRILVDERNVDLFIT